MLLKVFYTLHILSKDLYQEIGGYVAQVNLDQLFWCAAYQKTIFKIPILSNDHKIVFICIPANLTVCRMPPVLNIVHMNDLEILGLKIPNGFIGNMDIAKKLHYATSFIFWPESESLAY